MVSEKKKKVKVEENNDELTVKREQKNGQEEEEGIYLDSNKKYLSGEYVMKRLGISEKTLIALAESGEFGLGRVGGRIIVDKESLLRYLDRCHFVGAESPDDEVVFDSKGRIKPGLTYVKEKHTEVPELKKISEFAKRLVPPLDNRSFIRHCDIGTFYHYRIGTTYKMSEEDWEKSLEKITKLGMKSARGGRRNKAGRPSEISKKIPNLNAQAEQQQEQQQESEQQESGQQED